jgi:hypothetical protein
MLVCAVLPVVAFIAGTLPIHAQQWFSQPIRAPETSQYSTKVERVAARGGGPKETSAEYG